MGSHAFFCLLHTFRVFLLSVTYFPTSLPSACFILSDERQYTLLLYGNASFCLLHSPTNLVYPFTLRLTGINICETLPSVCYILFDESSIPFYSTSESSIPFYSTSKSFLLLPMKNQLIKSNNVNRNNNLLSGSMEKHRRTL